MFITLNGEDYELSTKLGTAVAIEKKFGLPVMRIFGNIGEATTSELIDIVSIAASKQNDSDFRKKLLDEFDYIDLLNVVRELTARLMFGGNVEQTEAKLSRFPASEEQKNELRELLGMPIPQAPTETEAPLTGSE